MDAIVKLGGRMSIEHEARQWLIRMDADHPLSDAEKAALTEWMDRSARHRSELTRLAGFWSQANTLVHLIAGCEFRGTGREEKPKPPYPPRSSAS
jgi:ferric-dicitrate binding protein FerR (iron transport regulator)